MDKQHAPRRWFLNMLVVLVAAATVLGTAQGTSAADDIKSVDFADAEVFRSYCEANDGDFDETWWGTNCYWQDGGVTRCDRNGQDCWYTPPPTTAPPHEDEGPLGDVVVDPLDPSVDAGTGSPDPGVDSPPATDDAPSLAAPGDDQPAKHKHGKGKKHKHGKGRRR